MSDGLVADLGELVNAENAPDIFPVLCNSQQLSGTAKGVSREPTAPASLRKQFEYPAYLVRGKHLSGVVNSTRLTSGEVVSAVATRRCGRH